MANECLQLVEVAHRFGATEVLRGLSLTIQRGEFVALVGPSGCGKTTLLKLLSGHLAPTAGSIRGAGRARAVYQQDGLFPWLTAAENVKLGLRDVTDKAEQAAQLAELLKLIGLSEFAQHYPRQLSGGMRQRVELARALAGECDVLLLDEPFSALDYLNRLRLRSELARLLEERPRTVVLVTHDIEEAAQLADRIIILTERPATICGEITVTVPRPRHPTQPPVLRAVEQALAVLGFAEERAPATPVISLNVGVAVSPAQRNGHYAATTKTRAKTL